MDKQPLLPTPEESKQHYRVPEDYFDQLEERIMARTPETPVEAEAEPARPSLWVRVRPIVYLAAVFVSMNLVFRAFRSVIHPDSTTPQQVATATTAEEQDEAYSTYYAEYGAEVAAQDAHESLFADGTLFTSTAYSSSY